MEQPEAVGRYHHELLRLLKMRRVASLASQPYPNNIQAGFLAVILPAVVHKG